MKIALVAFLILFTTTNLASNLIDKGNLLLELPESDRTIPVWYYIPANATASTPLLFVMHGVLRNADEYRDAWLPHAEKLGVILVVPEFSQAQFPKSWSYNLGNIYTETGKLKSVKDWSFTVIEEVFDVFRAKLANVSESYYLYGHSAGSQFVHRMLYFLPDARVRMAIAANAGWYTLPDLTQDYPYGLGKTGIRLEQLKPLLTKSVVILLGDKDTDPNDQYLRRTEEADAQGLHRFARGQFYYQVMSQLASKLDSAFMWRMEFVPGVDHNNTLMAPAATKIIAADLAADLDIE